ncbi:MAG: DUF2075 domain-containing protein [Candidatus Binataceae bacterium]
MTDNPEAGAKRGYTELVERFLAANEDLVVGVLVRAVAASGIESQRSTQIIAWRQELGILKAQLGAPEFRSWNIAIEYNLPRRSKRPDVILLANDLIFVIEFKLGATSHDASARWQVEEYCLNLRDFHAESNGRTIIPVLCASEASSHPLSHLEARGQTTAISEVLLATRDDLGVLLMKAYKQFHKEDAPTIDPLAWYDSRYQPTPTIVEAAVHLYERHGVREISHRYAYNLDRTTEMLVQVIKEARQERRHVICFVTGIPGAGKTLTGLDVVHDPDLRADSASAGIFLSGNGPLVKIVRESLVISQTARGRRRGECEHEVSTFIQNVHTFLTYYLSKPNEFPHEHLVVFDEAQRAWDGAQMKRKRRGDSSEASMLLEVMERLPEWAVVIALVGGGQEIFLGEAGLEEWGRALSTRSTNWRVVASPEVLKGGASVAGQRLFPDGVSPSPEFHPERTAHLEVGVRSHRAQQFAEWVNDLLAFNLKSCQQTLPAHREFPLVMTRDLEQARAWLRARCAGDGDERCGLVATSADERLRAYGLERSSEFRRGYSFKKWFLAPPDDSRSSFSLEVAASEFECQGLELDWVGLCWGGDLSPKESGHDWEYRRFRSRWEQVRQESERAYVSNRYRVLLTRARKGMVIWVPRGSSSDPTRDPARFDRIFACLRAAGVPNIEQDFLKEFETHAA